MDPYLKWKMPGYPCTRGHFNITIGHVEAVENPLQEGVRFEGCQAAITRPKNGCCGVQIRIWDCPFLLRFPPPPAPEGNGWLQRR